MRAVLQEIRHESPEIQSFLFQPAKRFRYDAGQFIELTLPDMTDGQLNRRWFTLSSSPTEPLLAVTTRSADQHGPYKKALKALTLGDSVDISDPLGDFVLPIDTSRPLIFVASGIGITPFRSFMQWITDNHDPRQTQLLYGAKSSADFIFREIFDTAKQCTVRYVAQEPAGKPYVIQGRLNGKMIAGLCRQNSGALVYLAGPEHIVERLGKELVSSGIPPASIITDFFAGYAGSEH